MLGKDHRLLIVDGVGREPRIEGRGIKVPQLDGFKICTVSLRNRRRGPRKVNARLNLALLLESRGQNAEGLQQIDDALARRPLREDRLRLAEALELLGAPEQALGALEPLLAQDPPDPDAAALQAQIHRARGIPR